MLKKNRQRLMLNGIFALAFFFITGTGIAQINFRHQNFNDLLALAKDENKVLFVDAYASWSSPCRWMSNNVFNAVDLGAFYNTNFISTKIDMDSDAGYEFREIYDVTAYPTLFFIKPNGTVIRKQAGALDKNQLLMLGQHVLGIETKEDVTSGNPNETSIPGIDGRFTLGTRGQRLMYGYPYPNSTSHFVVTVDKKQASNSPRFQINRSTNVTDFAYYGKSFFRKLKQKWQQFRMRKKKHRIKAYKNITYLSDTLFINFRNAMSLESRIDYTFKEVLIGQSLTPLSSDFKELGTNDTASYYRIAYTFKNQSDTTKTVGFLKLFDTMIDDNDAAQMDVFMNAGLADGQKISLRNKARRGKQIKYTNLDMPERIMVYHSSKKRTKALTGDFYLTSRPDELHIGSWPEYYGILWKTSSIKKDRKYYDSAILLKWNERKLKPGELLEISLLYGMHNKGTLEMIPVGTKYTGSGRDGKPIVFDYPKFSVSSDTIRQGDSLHIDWHTNNPMDAEVDIITNKRIKVENSGRISIKPHYTDTYSFVMKLSGKYIANLSETVTVLPKLKKQQLNGRFNLGGNPHAITYGYPHRYSNSFFVTRNNLGAFTNSSIESNAEKLVGERYTNGGIQSFNQVIYQSDSFAIKQYILPVNTNQSGTETIKVAAKKIGYRIINHSQTPLSGAFRHYTDLNNQSAAYQCIISLRDTVRRGTVFNAHDLPSGLLFIEDSVISMAISFSEFHPPSKVSYGQWPSLSPLPKPDFTVAYTHDMGILIDWRYEKLAPQDSIDFGFTVATPGDSLSVKYDMVNYVSSRTVHFDTNDSVLSQKSKKEIASFLRSQRNRYDIIEIVGNTDNVGTIFKNLHLSETRSQAVKDYITNKMQILPSRILIKAHGEYRANQERTEETENQEYRKVTIRLLRTKIMR